MVLAEEDVHIVGGDQLKINKVLSEASVANSLKVKYKYRVVFLSYHAQIIWWVTWFINLMH